jgi:prepilin-type N-terminal cleavage/methylation domain-containing protein
MTARLRSDSGFTVVELVIAMALFLVMAGSVYSVVLSGTRGSNDARNLINISEEARLALNRMVRDTRQADVLGFVTPSAFNVRVDFNGDGVYENPNAAGDFEDLTFAFNPSTSAITLNGETLIEGVSPIPGKQIFSYASNYLEYDANQDGITIPEELDAATADGTGNGNGILDGGEIDYVTNVIFSIRVQQGKKFGEFLAEAQLRNRR